MPAKSIKREKLSCWGKPNTRITILAFFRVVASGQIFPHCLKRSVAGNRLYKGTKKSAYFEKYSNPEWKTPCSMPLPGK
jgi:hypothetical protein